jgi:hypothetical protein
MHVMENIGRDLRQMKLSADKNSVVVIDNYDDSLRTIDTNGKIIEWKNLSEEMHCFWLKMTSICMTSQNYTIVASLYWGLYVLDQNYKIKDKIDDFSSDYLIMDDRNPSFLFASFVKECKICLIDINQVNLNHVFHTIRIDRPFEMFAKDDKIYVVSFTNFKCEKNEKSKRNRKKRKFVKITYGSNCIFVIDKKTLEIIQIIKSDYWLRPRSVHVDENDNILTCAYKIDDINWFLNSSIYLYLINMVK